MGRAKKEGSAHSQKKILKGFKAELIKYRRNEKRIIEYFKKEIRKYKRTHKRTITQNFEIALKRLLKEDATKRSKFSAFVSFFIKKNYENSYRDTENNSENLSVDSSTTSMSSLSSISSMCTISSCKYEEHIKNISEICSKCNASEVSFRTFEYTSTPTLSENLSHQGESYCEYKSYEVESQNGNEIDQQSLRRTLQFPKLISVSSISNDELSYRQFLEGDSQALSFNNKLMNGFTTAIEKCNSEFSDSSSESSILSLPSLPSYPGQHCRTRANSTKTRKRNRKKKRNR
ncbi:uncharacterized protein LOC119690056 [Teleopsis dalmanni]|uniref:uncharacterized protein LOC119690056 n=1 Tax=Teleopsis dalmanni TaxID=139649 RepID=UPI0018CC908D|nr:uncharacterized protein LOC119690056 [Teleopsis dalmanni]